MNLKSNNIEVFVDWEFISSGDDFKQKCEEKIRTADFFLPCFSAVYQQRTDNYMNLEINVAMEKWAKFPPGKKWIIPIKLTECKIPDFTAVNNKLTTLHFINFYDNWQAGLNELLTALDIKTVNDINAINEWAVSDIKLNTAFFKDIHKLYDLIKNRLSPEETEIVITLYAQSFPENGVGKFEFDFVYYRNLSDDAPMFGPIVKDDDRTKFVNNDPEVFKWQLIDRNNKPGGFIDRKKIRSCAKFKLGNKFWPSAASTNSVNNRVSGLLFINGRSFPIPLNLFYDNEIMNKISDIEDHINIIRKEREFKYNNRRGPLLVLDLMAGIGSTDPDHVDQFFKRLRKKIAEIIKYDDFRLAAYLFIEAKNNEKKNYLK